MEKRQMQVALLRQGALDMLPLLVGLIPFGLACGMLAIEAGFTAWETIAMSLLVFAGAAQFIAIGMVAAGVSDWKVLTLTALIVNLRHILMGASLLPYVRNLSLGRQAVLAFGMVDETYTVTMNRIRTTGYTPAYQLGTNGAAYAVWVACTAAGTYLGSYAVVLFAWGLDFAMPATFLAMLLPRLIEHPPSRWVAAVAAVCAVGGKLLLPGAWYILAACVAAVITGGVLEERRERHD